VCLIFFSCIFSFLFVWWNWGFNLGLHAFKAGTLVTLELGLHELFGWAGLELQSS
jgi:hypothetical protein